LTVSVTVAVCAIDPEVAVTVTVATTGGVFELDDALHPLKTARLAPMKASNAKKRTARRRFHASRHVPKARVVAGRKGVGLGREAAELAAAAMESVVVTAALVVGATVEGLNEQLAPDGSPEQAKPTLELNPSVGVTVSVTVPCAPDCTVSEDGDAAKVKVGAGAAFTTWETEEDVLD
jgi:hypothetical protein